MATNQLRIKKATENILKTIEEAKACKPAPVQPPKVKDPDLVNEFKNLVSGSFAKSTTKKSKLPASGAMQKREEEVKICGCGEVNVPMIKGYCMTCIKKLKTRYDALLDEYAAL